MNWILTGGILVAVVMAFLLGAQTSYVLTKRAIKLKIEEEIVRIDDTHQYSMIWYRGYRNALGWVINVAINQEEPDDYSV